MTTQIVDAARVLAGGDADAIGPTRITFDDGVIGDGVIGDGVIGDGVIGDGVIGDVAPAASGRGLVMPALANAHDHCRLARLSQVDSYDVPLEAWLPYLALIPAVDPWLAAAVSFARSAEGGAGSVMAHYTRVQGLTDFPAEAVAVARAARDVGLRIGFAVQLRDRNPLVYGDHAALAGSLSPRAAAAIERRLLRPGLPAAEQVALVEAVAQAIEGDGVTVQFGPAGVQWCSDDLLARIAERSAATARRVHMHLLETRYQRDWADAEYPDGIVVHLDRIGLLSERLSVAHGVHLRPEEIELLAERGVTIVTNTSSNLILSSGLAPVGEFLRRGCRVAVGLDGAALDEDEDALREMRLGYALHKGLGFERRIGRGELITMATTNGRRAITGDERDAAVAPGAAADLLTLDWDALAADLIDPDTPPLSLVLARGTAEHVLDLYVGGRVVVRDGRATGVDLPALEAELIACLRAGWAGRADLRAAMPELSAAFARLYAGRHECC